MDTNEFQLATFAGGCFWCIVKPFEETPGIIKVSSGFTGGTVVNPTYEEVCSKTTGHYEAIQISYDPLIFTYRKLLDIYWQLIDPTNPEGQFTDLGQTYKTVIFYHNQHQHHQALESKKALEVSGKFEAPIVTEILPAVTFYPAEEYHQNYHQKNPVFYNEYRKGTGRDAFIKEHWSIEKGEN